MDRNDDLGCRWVNPPEVEEDAALAVAEEERHEKRKARARDYARRKRNELRLVQDKVVVIYNELVRMGVYQQLSDEAREFFDVYVHREAIAQYPYPSTMYRMFGRLIAPGAECTLKEAMQRLYRGKNDINFLVRKWERKHGVHISIVPDDNGDALLTRYVITRVDPLEERAHVDDVKEIMGVKEQSKFRDYKSRQ